MMILSILLIASLLLNAILLWYATKILSRLLFVADSLGDLYIGFRQYQEFVDQLFQMDMFFGEPIIEELLNRTKTMRSAIEEFQEIYDLTTYIEEVEEAELEEEYDGVPTAEEQEEEE